jgi:hypothetical protein
VCGVPAGFWPHTRAPAPNPRAVLAFFRARALRTDGAAALAGWRAAARAAAACRRALTHRWNSLLVRAFGAWLIAREQARMARAAAHHDARLARMVLTRAWPAGAAAARRRRALEGAAAAMATTARAARGLAAWAAFAGAQRREKAALHWAARRRGCLALSHWSAVSRPHTAMFLVSCACLFPCLPWGRLSLKSVHCQAPSTTLPPKTPHC